MRAGRKAVRPKPLERRLYFQMGLSHTLRKTTSVTLFFPMLRKSKLFLNSVGICVTAMVSPDINQVPMKITLSPEHRKVATRGLCVALLGACLPSCVVPPPGPPPAVVAAEPAPLAVLPRGAVVVRP